MKYRVGRLPGSRRSHAHQPKVSPGESASRAFTWSAIGVVALSLVSCTPLDRISVRYENGDLQFASCHSLDANIVEVAARSPSDSSTIESLWQVEGTFEVEYGDVFTFGQSIEGGSTTLSLDVPSNVEQIFFTVGFRNTNGEFGDARSARFFVADIREGEWTRTNGSRGEEPCE